LYAETGGSLLLPSSSTIAINSNGSYTVSVDSAAPSTAVGWANIQASGPLYGHAIFRWRSPSGTDSEGTATMETAASSLLLPFDNTNGFRTGLAVANPTSAPVFLGLTVFDESGQLIGVSALALTALGHFSGFTSDILSKTANQRGVVKFSTSTDSSAVSMIGLRFSPAGSFTSIPVIK
jgi:hypothetical protein